MSLIKRAVEIVSSCKSATLSVIDTDGFPYPVTLSINRTNGLHNVYFATGLNSKKCDGIRGNNKVAVCFAESGNNITLTGFVEIITRSDALKSMWQDWYKDHFSGIDDPNYCIVKFTSKDAALWIDGKFERLNISDIPTGTYCGLLCYACSFKEPCNCGGCVATKGNPFHGECPIGTCCNTKGYAHCGECSEIPCQQMLDYSCNDPEHGDNPAGERIELCKFLAKS